MAKVQPQLHLHTIFQGNVLTVYQMFHEIEQNCYHPLSYEIDDN